MSLPGEGPPVWLIVDQHGVATDAYENQVTCEADAKDLGGKAVRYVPARQGGEESGGPSEVFLIRFKYAAEEWDAGTLHATAEKAAAFAESCQGYTCDPDEAAHGERITFDSFKVLRYVPSQPSPSDTELRVRDWAVRVLDAEGRKRGGAAWSPYPNSSGGFGMFAIRGVFSSESAARLAAARAVWPSLPADVRAEIGSEP